ncbi:DUF998 domain-containing protein [Luethyella okanaganae]|uniref:DUF998 domain-containing protein n=1 Tax=Luethyella okanaganae TaxID=69372 RepID=A0ABW1VDN8_9MICO
MSQAQAQAQGQDMVKKPGVVESGGGGGSKLLVLGSFGGPLFVVLVLIQMAVVPWFDIVKFPLSVLSVGETWWMNKTAFLGGGLLTLAGAIGLRRTLRGRPSGAFGPLLIGVFGVGLVGSGIFDVDPGDGAPPGSPALTQSDYTWHMYAHNLSSMVAFICLSIACFVFVRRFTHQGKWAWIVVSVCVGVVTFVLFFLPVGTPSLRLAIATLLMFSWTTALFLSTRAASRVLLV